MKVSQSLLTLCNLGHYAVPGILQASILERVSFPFPGDIPNAGPEPGSPALQADSLPAESQVKPSSHYERPDGAPAATSSAATSSSSCNDASRTSPHARSRQLDAATVFLKLTDFTCFSLPGAFSQTQDIISSFKIKYFSAAQYCSLMLPISGE